MIRNRLSGLTLKQADEIIREAKLFGWAWVVLNAACYGLTSTEMLYFWCQNDNMTPNERFPDACWLSLDLPKREAIR